ncbi:MAG: S-layer homology domain-containing protein [Lawsonibacter sp.]|nr:S-layer homology domain-containing protein [Lawsonibacter sp.]
MKHRLTALAAVLALVLSLGFMGTASAASQSSALETIRALGIMVGDSGGNLNLSSSVTRAEFVTMMTAVSAYKDTVGSGYGVSLFKDVKSTHWASEYVKLAVEQNWMTGYVDGTFRPDRTITLEEACTAMLRLLGYDSGSLAGSFPTAQLSKASAIGLLDDVTAVQGQALTRQDCVSLFYNLLVADNNSGTVYGTTLGYTVTNGEVNYSTLVNADTKGPYVASAAGSLTLPFGTSGITVYRNGVASSVSAVSQYDVYYYNTNLHTVWVYNNRVTGTLTGLSPSKTAPTSVTVAGVSYTIGTASATYKLSSQGGFAEGNLVTLLLGMNGDVADVISAQDSEAVYYGVVVSSTKSASSSSTSSSATASVQVATQVACTDGTVRTFYHSGGALSSGNLASVSVTQSGTAVKSLSSKSLSGTVNSSGTKFAGYDFADHVQILDTDENGGYVRIYPSRLAGSSLDSDDVRYYTLNADGAIDCLVLNQVTGDTWTYVYLSKAEKSTGDTTSASYEYVLNGMTYSLSSSKIYSASTGGAAFLYEDGSLSSMKQLTSVTVTDLSTLYATASDKKYSLAEDVQVLLKDSSGIRGYYATTLSAINLSDYTVKGWYDNLGCSAGGRIRILVATAID